jgi:asparagine synthase (glutamine-hydrolysing)
MSAIGGILQRDGLPCDQGLLAALAARLRHRAPDGERVWSAGPVGLTHGRLITTPESAHEQQPIADEATRVAITFDGRLDNRTELLDLLGIDRVDHAAIGDAELVLRLYRALGVSCVGRLLGDFAFAVWDGNRSKLLCARDHLGLRPFSYRVTPARIAWASEPGALAGYEGLVPPVNEGMVAEHLAGVVTSTSDTVFEGVFRLPAGHLMTADDRGVEVRRYWSPDLQHELRYADPGEYVEQLRDLVRRAVAARLRVAGSVGVWLSGGVDSSSITGVAATLCRERAVPASRVETYSARDAGLADERAFWSQVADRWQLPSIEVPIAPIPSGQLAEEARVFLDVPNSPLEAIMDRLRASMRARGTRVALTGHGGDEWLGPSYFNYADLMREGSLVALARRLRSDSADEWFMGWPRVLKYTFWPLVPSPLQQSVRRILRRGRAPEWIDPAFAARVELRERLARHAIDLPYSSLARYDAWHEGISGSSAYLEETIERSCSRLGVEMWHPLMDRRIVEFGLALPSEQQWGNGRRKDLLRRAMAPYLPEAIAARIAGPNAIHLLFEGLTPEGGRALFQNMTAARRGWVREEVLLARYDRAEALYRAGDKGYAYLTMALWHAAAIELWARTMAAETVVQ